MTSHRRTYDVILRHVLAENITIFLLQTQIYDGYSATGPYCGRELPKDVISEARRLHIMFVSDGVENVGRFNLTYEILDGM